MSSAGEQDPVLLDESIDLPDESSAPVRPLGPGHVGFVPFAVSVEPTPESHAVLVAARVLAGSDATVLSDDECLGVLDDLELARRSLAAAGADVIAEIESRALTNLRYGTATRVWFERRHGRSRHAVNRQIRVGKRLRSTLGDIGAALARGEITSERVEVIAGKVNPRNADAFTAAQSALLALSAAEPSFERFRALVDDLARFADADGGHDPTEPSNSASKGRVDNELEVTARLVGLDAETFEQLWDTATDRLLNRPGLLGGS